MTWHNPSHDPLLGCTLRHGCTASNMLREEIGYHKIVYTHVQKFWYDKVPQE